MTSSAMASAASAVSFGWGNAHATRVWLGRFPVPDPDRILAAGGLYPSSLSSTASLKGAPATSRPRRGTR
jgi:hypothetical protein